MIDFWDFDFIVRQYAGVSAPFASRYARTHQVTHFRSSTVIMQKAPAVEFQQLELSYFESGAPSTQANLPVPNSLH